MIGWNLDDVKKTQSRMITSQLEKVLGPSILKTLQYNPPFGYSILNYHDDQKAENVILGLGNGSLLKLKGKKMAPQDVAVDVHKD